MPVETIVPTVEFPAAIPFTLQLSAVAGLPLAIIVAAKTCAPPLGTLAGFGATDIAISSFKVTLAAPLPRVFNWLTAITVTLAGDGSTAGAV